MPVTFGTPLPPVLGPYVAFSWQSDFIGPLPADTQWHVDVYSGLEPTAPLTTVFIPTQQIFGNYTIYLRNPTFSQTISPANVITEGADSRVQVQLVTPTGVVDSGVLGPIPWSTTANVGMQIFSDLPASGSFTAQDRLTLQQIDTSTQVTLPTLSIPAGKLVAGIGELLACPPPGLLQQHGSVIVSGTGSFQRGAEPWRVDAYGLTYSLFTVPPGFGFSIGAVPEFERRLVQFSIIGEDTGGETFLQAVYNSHHEGDRFTWCLPNPVRVDYSIQPGLEIVVQFLVLALA